MYSFYHAASNPANVTGLVGGAITTVPVSGYLGELFEHVEAPPSGASVVYYQYRKLFVKNEGTSSSTYTRVWLDALEHPEQIAIAGEYTANQTSTNPLTEPSNVTVWDTPTNYAEGLDLGTLTANSSSGIWIREKLTEIQESDPYATFRIYAGGIPL